MDSQFIPMRVTDPGSKALAELKIFLRKQPLPRYFGSGGLFTYGRWMGSTRVFAKV